LHEAPRRTTLASVPRRTPRVTNRLPDVLAGRGLTWGEVGRRALVPARHLRALRAPHANPPLALAERVAAALGTTIEELWTLAVEPAARGSR